MLLRKVVTAFLMPTGLLWLALGMAALATRKRRRLRWLVSATWLGLTLAANPMVSVFLVQTLERPYYDVRPLEATERYDAVLVLGGGTSLTHRGRPQLGDSGDRLRLAAALFAAGRADRLVTSGSSIDGRRDLARETEILFTQMGVPRSQIVTVAGPVNTAQEIRALADLAEERGWHRIGIVTSGYHMRRAQALCRRHGLNADPLPADRRTLQGSFSILSLLPQGGSLALTDKAVKEYLGLLAVHLFGG